MKRAIRTLSVLFAAMITVFAIQSMAEAANININESNFPNAVFRQFISSNYDLDHNGVLSDAERNAVTKMDVSGRYIVNLTGDAFKGIEYFTELTELDCSANFSQKLDLSKNTKLEKLDCSGNEINKLYISACTKLIVLDCSDNDLRTLTVSCFPKLTELYCGYNEINEMDFTKNPELVILNIEHNDFKEVDLWDNTKLEYFYSDDNNLRTLNIADMTSIKEIHCYNNRLTILHLEGCTGLEEVWCNQNRIANIYIKDCTSLRILAIDDSRFENETGYMNVLDLSGAPNIKVVYCKSSRLHTAAFAGNTSLEELYCDSNRLSQLDLTGCTSLKILQCNSTQWGLGSIILKDCSSLEELYINSNNLPKLDVSDCVNLKKISCSSNQLKELDFSGLTKLESVTCTLNQLEEINFTGCESLTYVNCLSNKIKKLNFSDSPKLSELQCSINELTELVLTGCGELKTLNCMTNQLKELDVSDCVTLESLNCSDNMLEGLDVTSCTKLKSVNCSINHIPGIDLENNTELTELISASQTLTLDVEITDGKNIVDMNKVVPTPSKVDSASSYSTYNKTTGIAVFSTLPESWTYTYNTGAKSLSSVNMSVTAVFAERCRMTSVAVGMGTVSPSGLLGVRSGESLSYTFTPNAGHYIGDVLIDGKSVGAVTEYAFENITANHTVSVIFLPVTYKVTATSDMGGSISPTGDNLVTHGSSITFKITPSVGYAIADVIVDGESVGAVEEYTFKNVQEEHSISVTYKKTFVDIVFGEYYYKSVLWAVDKRITTGKDADNFGPDENCTRAQVVTFLWRALGYPEPTIKDCPFTDVNKNEYYYKAVMWAYENNITTGATETTFEPDEFVTRGQFVTLLYRVENCPATQGNSPFTDVSNKQEYYYNAVVWAYVNNITKGTSETTFGPDEICTRGQVVTFLYRALEKGK